MKVQALMTQKVATCGPDDNAHQAAHLMWDGDCGFIPVVDADKRLRGVVTDRDICMAAYTQGRTLEQIPIRALAESGCLTVKPDEDVSLAHNIMRENRVRRLPVVDALGHLVGVLSLTDLARRGVSAKATKDVAVTASEVAKTLAKICEPWQQTKKTAE